MGVVAVVALAALILALEVAGVESATRAPLFALCSATGLALSMLPALKHHPRDLQIRTVVIISAFLSGTHWALSREETWLDTTGIILSVIAYAALTYGLIEEAKSRRPRKPVEEEMGKEEHSDGNEEE